MPTYSYPPTGVTQPESIGITSGGTVGNQIYASSPGRVVTALGWYRHTAGDSAPSKLALFHNTGAVRLVNVTPADDGNVGWQYVAITPQTLVEGDIYTVEAGMPNGRRITGVTGHIVADDPLHNELAVNGSGVSDPLTLYTGTDEGNRTYGLSAAIDLDPDAAPTQGTVGTIVDTGIASWESTDAGVQTHETDGIPWLLKTELAATKLLVQGTLDSFKDADGNVRSIGDFAKEMTPTMVGIIKLFFNRADTQLTGETAAGGTAFAALADRMTDLENQLDGLEDVVTAAPVPFPGAGWTMADEVDFVQAKSWDVPADLYTLSTSGWPVNIRQVDVDGAPWRPRLGWWAVRNGDLLGPRRFVDWENSILEDAGRRMPGVVVWLEPSTAGTLQAWLLA